MIFMIFIVKYFNLMNPVSLREIRQMVRNKIVATGLIVYLCVQLFTVMLSVLSEAGNATHADIAGKRIGQEVANTVCVVLSILTIFAIPVFTGIRMILEKSDDSMDLQFATTLRPMQFIDGKITSSSTIFFLFTTATIPFLMLAYILRGVDLAGTFGSLGFMTVIAFFSFYAVVFIGSLNFHKIFRFTLLAGFMSLLAFVFIVESYTFFFFIYDDIWTEWYEFPVFALIFATLCLLLRAAASAQLAPPHTNGQFQFRLTSTILWLLWGAGLSTAALVRKDEDYLFTWFYSACALLFLMFFGAVSSRPGFNRRVLTDISPRRRLIQFPFFSSAESGVLHVLLLLYLTAFAGFAVYGKVIIKTDFVEVGQMISFLCYPPAFLITTRLVWHAGLRRFSNRKFVGIFASVWLALASILPHLFTIGNDTAKPEFWPGNLFAVLDCYGPGKFNIISFHSNFSFFWLLLTTIIYTPFIVRAFRQFRIPN